MRIVIVGHGTLPSGLRDAAELILGAQEHLHVVELPPEQSPEGLRADLVRALEDAEQAVVLTDVFGGTPHNVAAVEGALRTGVEVLTGASLPMVIEVLTNKATCAAELAAAAVEAGRSGVAHVKLTARANGG
ncbi:PTS fructose transporter subunit IIA [Lentzea sp. NBRC 105346]|uniref:PTS sugar transporter subunit IIA n=1 Tax=Lentzea sp. NBRC 105346 TaxID=3032205 RepID=UPI00249FE110|nr:PTS sugar transporter subunit IIA [Lentzea sp. NBRC 105346]GLZ31754.1 PTS fructose transporter subunit IIA [Lentzea sp. NBRC 105346]